MAKLYRTGAKMERDHDFEVAVWAGAVVGLDEAARSGDVVVFAGDPRSANPGPKSLRELSRNQFHSCSPCAMTSSKLPCLLRPKSDWIRLT